VLGTLRLPVILLLAGNPTTAAGTNIAISAAAAASGSYEHVRARRVHWPTVAWMGVPSIAGAVVGALGGHLVPEQVLLGVIAAVLAWNGADLLLRVRPRPARRLRRLSAVASGLFVGVLGGALGVILGTLRMPALLRLVGLDVRRAVGTNLVVGFMLGVFGFAAHAVRLEVEWDLLAGGLAGALPGGWLGARLTGRASELALRRGIGAALLAVALAFAVETALH
jgi:uncharacterized membrane protein YfcA